MARPQSRGAGPGRHVEQFGPQNCAHWFDVRMIQKHGQAEKGQ